jgi:hypothetical protein
MKGWRRERREWAALAAAFALLLHTMVAGLVDGAMASPQLLDIFGNVICTSHGAEKAPVSPGEPGNHSHLPECCLVGCSVVGGHAMSGPIAPVLPAPAFERLKLAQSVYHAALQRSERSPLNPRAPPFAV